MSAARRLATNAPANDQLFWRGPARELLRAIGAAALGGVLALAAHPASGEELRGHLHWIQTARTHAARIAVATTIGAEPGRQAQFPVEIEIPDTFVGNNVFLVIKGLPATVTLSEGYAIAPRIWVIPIARVPAATMSVPGDASGRWSVALSLLGKDGSLLAEAATEMIVAPSPPPKLVDTPKLAENPEAKVAAAIPHASLPAMTPVERQSAERLIARGEEELQRGNLASARQFFLRAAQIGIPRGAFLLATTYDPHELARMRAVSVQANVAEARRWYERARELGAPEAAERLARLGGS